MTYSRVIYTVILNMRSTIEKECLDGSSRKLARFWMITRRNFSIHKRQQKKTTGWHEIKQGSKFLKNSTKHLDFGPDTVFVLSVLPLHKKWSFPWRISSVNLNFRCSYVSLFFRCSEFSLFLWKELKTRIDI